MLKLLLILISIISVGFSQVAPSYQPYSIIHAGIELPTTQLTVGYNFHINFMNNAHVTNMPDGIIYRLAVQLNGIYSGYLSIIDICPDLIPSN